MHRLRTSRTKAGRRTVSEVRQRAYRKNWRRRVSNSFRVRSNSTGSIYQITRILNQKKNILGLFSHIFIACLTQVPVPLAGFMAAAAAALAAAAAAAAAAALKGEIIGKYFLLNELMADMWSYSGNRKGRKFRVGSEKTLVQLGDIEVLRKMSCNLRGNFPSSHMLAFAFLCFYYI